MTEHNAFADWLHSTLQHNPAARRALATADLPAASGRAIPYLAPWIHDRGHSHGQAMQLAAAALARSGIQHHPDISLGQCAARAGLAADSLKGRVAAIHAQPLHRAHPQITRLLGAAAKNGRGIDFSKLVNTYQWWDHEPLNARSARNRFLLEFYAPATRHTPTSPRPRGNP